MNEPAWLQSTDPEPMFLYLEGRVTDRKLRLFVVACCHRMWNSMRDLVCRTAVQIGEHYADGRADRAVLAAAFDETSQMLMRIQRMMRKAKGASVLKHDLASANCAGLSVWPKQNGRIALAAVRESLKIVAENEPA